MHNLSDEEVCARWLETPYYQYFCGEEFFQHKLTFDRSSMTPWRSRMGEEKLNALVRVCCAKSIASAAARFMPCVRSKSSVSAKAKPMRLTRSASR